MEWWVLFIIFWVVFGCGQGGRRGLRHRRRRHEIRGDGPARRIPAHLRVDFKRGHGRVPVQALDANEPRRGEPPFDKLQREFVDGVISLDEFERALDKIDPKHLP